MARDLIRIDSTNTGDSGSSIGERAAAEWVQEKLTEVGLDPVDVESGAPGRGNVIVRLPGANPTRGALLIHCHLDVVPADAAEWSVHPLSGEVADGFLWGRGAVDMQDMVAMSLAVLRQLIRDGVLPPRNLVFAFLADEESGGFFGARWLVRQRPELFEGVTEAIGEVGGFSETFTRADGDPVRAYLIETAEKGVTWMRLKASGTPGHASMLNTDNAVAALAAGVTRLSQHRFPQVITPALRDFLDGVTDLTGMAFPEDDLDAAIGEDPTAAVLPYMLSAGTDAKSFQELGIRHFGFAPLQLPAGLDFSALFHGIDERVPVAALEFGTRVLERFLRTC